MWIFKGIIYAGLLLCLIKNVKKKQKWQKELAMEERFEKYLSEVAANYGLYRNLDDALWEAGESDEEIYDKQNHFVQMFDAMCDILRQEGDLIKDGVSIFGKNVQYLKEELREHLRLEQNRRYLFWGLDMIAFLPIFFLPFVEWWGSSTAEGIAKYFTGSYGWISFVLLFVSTVVLYELIVWLLLPMQKVKKEKRLVELLLKNAFFSRLADAYVSRHYTKCLKKNQQLTMLRGYGNIRSFVVEKMLWGFGILLIAWLFFLTFHSLEKQTIAETVELNEYQKMMVSEEDAQFLENALLETFWSILSNYGQESAITENVLGNTEAQDGTIGDSRGEKNDGLSDWQELIRLKFQAALGTYHLETETFTFVTFLEDRIAEYRSVGWSGWEVFCCLLAFFVGVYIPEIMLLLTKWKMRDKKMEECLRLQTIVLLLIHFDGITVEEILQWMEKFAELFLEVLEKAVDTFSYRRRESLEELKTNMPEEAMKRICEALLYCDELPVEQAFANLEGERSFFLDKYQEEQRKSQREYAAFGKMIAYIPLFLLVVMGMVIPFIVEGITDLQMYSQEFF